MKRFMVLFEMPMFLDAANEEQAVKKGFDFFQKNASIGVGILVREVGVDLLAESRKKKKK